jgi:peptide/nickel transport system permease protein
MEPSVETSELIVAPGAPPRVAWLSQDQRDILRILFRNPLAVLGLLIVSFWVLMALIGPSLAPYQPLQMDMVNRLQPPDSEHVLGTDWLGRDVLSRLLSGAPTTLIIGFVPIALAILVGVPTGMIAGFFGGWVETVIMRTADVFLSVPALVLAIAVTAALGPSLVNAMFAVSFVWWPWYTRLVHGQTLALSRRVFVEAAVAIGTSRRTIIMRHILPNVASSIFVRGSLDLGFAVLTMAGLGFIGMGAQAPDPEWGLTVSLGRRFMPEYWWISVFPGLAIFSIVLGFNLLGDGIRDALDPEIRGR